MTRLIGPMLGSLLSALAIVVLFPASSVAGCAGTTQANLNSVASSCTSAPQETAPAVSSGGDRHVYSVEPSCGRAFTDSCEGIRQQICLGPDGAGLVYFVLRDGEEIGTVCLLEEDAETGGDPIPGLALREFQRLDWLAAQLVVQPPGGRTLVNFETLFHTKRVGALRQNVTLLGRRVIVEARPIEYLWHADVDGPSWSTTDPGRPWREGDDATQLNHFVYDDAGVTVHPSVDVVYEGWFRVGNGSWVRIPETRTFAGPSQSLRVVEAKPVLVGTY